MDTLPLELVTSISNYLDLKSFILFTSSTKDLHSLLRNKPCRMILNLFSTVLSRIRDKNVPIIKYVYMFWRILIFEIMITNYMTEELTSTWTRIVGVTITRSSRELFTDDYLSMQIICMNYSPTLSLFKWVLQFETLDKPDSNRSISLMKKLHEYKHPQTNYVCYLHSLSSNQEVLDYLHSNGCYLDDSSGCCVVPLTWDQWHNGNIRINHRKLFDELRERIECSANQDYKSYSHLTLREQTFWNTNSFDTKVIESLFIHVIDEIITDDECEDVVTDEVIDTGSWNDEIFNYDKNCNLRRTFNIFMLEETRRQVLIPIWPDYSDPRQKDASPVKTQEDICSVQ